MRARHAAFLAPVVVAAAFLLRPDPPEDPAPAAPRFLYDPDSISEEEKKSEGHAWEMFEWWYSQRAYPNELIPKDAYWKAWTHKQTNLPAPDDLLRSATWSSLGPDNVGGRMLAVAVDPTDVSRVWAGAASGGLWLSTTGGEGANAWTRVETGFPSLSVSAIVLDPADPDVMYIGTGEISRYVRPLVGTPGARASYGLGVLKSTDGGVTWNTTGLTWTFDQTRAVLAMKAGPLGTNVVWAATSEGLYKTTDAGANWTLSHAELMAMDVVVDPTNANVVYVSHGQIGVPPDGIAGIYKTTNGGTSWTLLGGGLPATDFGRTSLTISANGQTLYAGVASATGHNIVGLYRTTNGGTTWTSVNSTNFTGGQAWYDNVVAVSPTDNNLVIAAGLDVYRTTNGGSNLSQVAFWWAGYGGVIPNGGDEGPSDYVHADQHAITFEPGNPQTVYIGCDGGVFKSTDGGQNWDGKNGGLQTTQFYAGFADAPTFPLALGGLQDNGTLLYTGSPSWDKTFGGDGGWCAIDPTDEQTMYEEYVYLNMHKTTDGGASWNEIHSLSSGSANFIAPFVLAESAPNVIYGGMLAVEKTTNGGNSWFYPDGDSNWNGTQVATIGVSPTDADRVIAGTGNSGTSPTMEVRWTTDGGANWNTVAAGQLPVRYPTDFHYDRNDADRIWATFSGYGTGHVWESSDAGATWTDRSANLPDIPMQCVALDEDHPGHVYVGTDLGTYQSTDGGASWQDFNSGMPIAMILDLVVHGPTRTMRAATFGNGIWEVGLPEPQITAAPIAGGESEGPLLRLGAGQPNPFRDRTTIEFALDRPGEVQLTVHDAAGRRVRTLVDGRRDAGTATAAWDGRDESGQPVAAGVYFLTLEGAGGSRSGKITLLR
ncbi:MAG: FlgD immunoglobulin-like domain containing protein [Candidatus Eiseniibacteriota bacterium]